MGNQSNRQSSELTFYSNHSDRIYGNGQIYQSTRFPNCFIIKTLKLLLDQNQYKLYSQIEDCQNIYLMGLYGYLFAKSCQCESKNVGLSPCVISYWEFLSYSLKDLYQYRKRIGFRFREQQIWNIVKACVNGYTAFQLNNIFYEFQPQKLMINQEGRVRLTWSHIEPKNVHLNFYQIQKAYHQQIIKCSIKTNSNFEEEPQKMSRCQLQRIVLQLIEQDRLCLSPQELTNLQTHQLTKKINFQKCNIFTLGIMLLQLCSGLSAFHTFYRGFALDYMAINGVMKNLQVFYSKKLLTALGSMLHENPLKRSSFAIIRQQFGYLMKGEYEIQMSLSKSDRKRIKGELAL